MQELIKFYIIKIQVFLFVLFHQLKPWKKVSGICLPLKFSIGFNTNRWIINGKYEEGEIKIVKKNLALKDKVMEIGTGLGFLTTFCAKVVGSENVNSFEANPLNIKIAKRVFKKNNVNPKVQNALLSNTDGYGYFPLNYKSRLASSLYGSSTKSVKITQLNLNTVIEKLQPNFLILDIEGAEYEIFKIIKFQSIEKIQVELHPDILGNEKIEEIFTILNRNGFIMETSLLDGRNYFFKKNN
jgi:FkbM family methyltransferase